MEKVLLEAHGSGRDFSVIIVDSRPMLEGEFSYHNVVGGRSFGF